MDARIADSNCSHDGLSAEPERPIAAIEAHDDASSRQCGTIDHDFADGVPDCQTKIRREF